MTTLPASNIREVKWQTEDFSACPEGLRTTAPLKYAEQFFVLRGKKEAWIDGDLMDRASVIKDIDADYSNLRQIIAISLEARTCRDATDEITSVVIDRWAQDDAELSREARDFVAMCKGEAFANAFRLEDA